MVVPDVRLLLKLGNEAQELHQGSLRFEVELVVLENILSPVRDFEKLTVG